MSFSYGQLTDLLMLILLSHVMVFFGSRVFKTYYGPSAPSVVVK